MSGEWFFKLEVYSNQDLVAKDVGIIRLTKKVLKELNRITDENDISELRKDLYNAIELKNYMFTEDEINQLVDAKIEDIKSDNNIWRGFIQLVRFVIIYNDDNNNQDKLISTGSLYEKYDGNLDWLLEKKYWIKKDDFDSIKDRPRSLTSKQIEIIANEIFYDTSYNEESIKPILRKKIKKYFEIDIKDKNNDMTIHQMIAHLFVDKHNDINHEDIIDMFIKDEFIEEDDEKNIDVNATINNIKHHIKLVRGIDLNTDSLEDIVQIMSNNKDDFFLVFIKSKYELKIPVIKGGNLSARRYATKLAIEWLSEELRGIKISHSDIPELIKLAKGDVKSSIAQPGASVGIMVGESLGSLNTQAVLNSVDWETKVYVRRKDKLILGPIGKFIDNIIDKTRKEDITYYDENKTEWVDTSKKKYMVTCVDEDGKMHWKKLEGVTRHLPGGKLIKVKTRSGREVCVTKNKSLLVRENNKIVPKKGDEIKLGDKVPLCMQMPELKNPLKEINITKHFPKTEFTYGSEMIKMKNHMESCDKKKDRLWWKSGCGKLFTVPYTRSDSARRGLDKKDYEEGIIYPLQNQNYISKIPESLILDRISGYFFGAYIAEGCVSDTYIAITNTDRTYFHDIEEFCKRYNIGYHIVECMKRKSTKPCFDIRIHSTIMTKYVKETCGKLSHNKKLPDWVYIANDDFVKGLLDSYMSGDCTVDKLARQVVVSSASKKLVVGISELCMRYGIFSRIGIHYIKENNIGSKNIYPVNTLSIRNDNAKLFANNITLSCRDKQERLNKCKNKIYKMARGMYDIIPGMNTKHFNGDVKRDILEKALNEDNDFEEDEIEIIKSSVSGDVYYDEITSLEEIDSTHENVYDFTVADTRNFTIFGGLCVRDSFHSSGQDTSSTMNTNVLSDVISSSKNPPIVITSVTFVNKALTYEQVYRLRSELVGVSYESLFVPNSAEAVEIERLENIDGIKWWHQYWLDDIDEKEIVLRLHFDVDKLYSYNINLTYIAEQLANMQDAIIKSVDSKIKGKDLSLYHVIPSPTHLGIIDIYPERTKIISVMKNSLDCSEDNSDMCILTFHKVVILNSLRKMIVKGIPGILEMYPQSQPVTQLIKMEKNINDPGIVSISLPSAYKDKDVSKIWIIYISEERIKLTGIKVENLVYLLDMVGIETLLKKDDYIVVYHPYDGKPSAYILDKVSKDKKKAREDVKRKRKEGINHFIKTNITPLVRASEYIYAILRGDKSSYTLQNVFSKDFVDQRHTYSSNSHELTSLLGIETAYNLIYHTLSVASENVGGSNKRHLDLVSQIITRQGKPRGLKTLSAKSNNGVLADATFSKASTVIANKAITGAKENLLNPSTAIALGQISKIGSGYRGDKFTEDIIDDKLLDDIEDIDRDEDENKEDEEDLEDQLAGIYSSVTGEDPELKASEVAGVETIKFVSLAGVRPSRQTIEEVDNIPIFISYPMKAFATTTVKSIEQFLSFNSDFNFDDTYNNIENKEVDLTGFDLEGLLSGEVISRVVKDDEVGFGSNSVKRVVDDFNNIVSLSEMFD